MYAGGVSGTTFTLVDNCDYKVWPSPGNTGFQLAKEPIDPTKLEQAVQVDSGAELAAPSMIRVRDQASLRTVTLAKLSALVPEPLLTATLAELTLRSGSQDF